MTDKTKKETSRKVIKKVVKKNDKKEGAKKTKKVVSAKKKVTKTETKKTLKTTKKPKSKPALKTKKSVEKSKPKNVAKKKKTLKDTTKTKTKTTVKKKPAAKPKKVASSEKAKAKKKVVKTAVKKSEEVKTKKKVVKKNKAKTVSRKNKEDSVVVAVNKKPVSYKNNSIKEEDSRDYFLKWRGVDFVRTIGETYLYYISLALGVLASIYFIAGGEILPAFTFIILIVVIAFELKINAREVNYEINPDGISIGEDFFYFNEIRSFDMGEKAEVPFVRIQMKKAVFPTKDIYLDQSFDLNYVEKLFAYFLPQEQQDGKLFNINPKKELTEDEFIDKAVNDYLNDKY